MKKVENKESDCSN